MRRLAVLVLLSLAALAASWSAPCATARADDGRDSVRERIEIVRRLPPEEQQRLRDALRRFKSLPEAERAELRRRAEQVGPERLRELVGRNVDRLRVRHDALQREQHEIVRLLGGEERFARLSEVERQYITGVAVRRFQKHVRRSLLSIAGPNEMAAFTRRSPEYRREKMEEAVRHLEAALLETQTPAYRAELAALPPHERRQRVRGLLVEHRLSLVQSFVIGFEQQYLIPFLQLPDAERRAAAERWAQRARWFELRRHLEQELGVRRDVLRLLADLGPEDAAHLRDEFDRTETMDPVERRLYLEEEIRAVHGRAAVSGDATGTTGRARLRRLLHEEKRRRMRDLRHPGSAHDGGDDR